MQAPKRKHDTTGDLKDVQLIFESKNEAKEVGINTIQQEKRRLGIQ